MVRSQPEEVHNAAYFASIDLTQLSDSEAKEAYDAVGRSLGTKSTDTVARAYRLTLTNQVQQKHVVLFIETDAAVRDDTGIWGLSCNADCSMGTPFLLLNIEATNPG
jgi:hypothetical protein